jgi:hypothetical protein
MLGGDGMISSSQMPIARHMCEPVVMPCLV